MNKKLYRSKKDQMIAGVCAGIGEYFELDPTLVRLAFILLSFAGGGGVIAYIICAIVIPEKPADYDYEKEEAEVFDKEGNPVEKDPDSTQKKTKKIIGIGLLILGSMMLFDKFFWWFDNGIIWGVAIVAIGGLLLFKPAKDEKM